jgi:uncharacterized membrane protein YbaN (DUF454 family)
MRLPRLEPAVKKKIFSIGKLILGSFLVVLGVVGLFLPFLQGFLFLFVGGSLLSSESKWVRGKMAALRKRFPRQTARVRAIKANLLSRWKKGLA